jgi:hypothetical protein
MRCIAKKSLFVFMVISVAGLRLMAGEELAPATNKGNVSIQLPKGWNVDVKGARSVLAALPPQRDKDESGEFQASFTITQEAGSKVDGAAQQNRLSREFPGYRAVETPTGMTVNGVAGVTFGGTFTNGKLQLRSRQYMFAQNTQIYVITFTCLNSRWGAYSAAVEASVATLSFKK